MQRRFARGAPLGAMAAAWLALHGGLAGAAEAAAAPGDLPASRTQLHPTPCGPGQREQPLVADGFAAGRARWRLEAQDPRTVLQAVQQGGHPALDLSTPAGATLWFDTLLQGDYVLRFVATPLPAPATAGALAGRVSDLNLLWNASEADGSAPRLRDGSFAGLDTLRAWYVGYGANGNTTTRLREYDGSGRRVLLDGWADPPEATPEDRQGPMTAATRLQPGRPVQVQLLSRHPTAADPVHLRWWANGRLLFERQGGTPLLQGHMALRTTASRWRYSRFTVARCLPD